MKRILILKTITVIFLVSAASILFISKSGFFNEVKSSQMSEIQDPFIVDKTLNQTEPNSAYLFAKEGIQGFGITKRIYNSEGFVNTISANLPELKDNFYYEAWLYRENGNAKSIEIVNLGKLEAFDNNFVQTYKNNEDLSYYNKVLITKEISDDGKPEKIVMEADFNI